MGRKPSVAKKGRAHLSESINPSGGEGELPPGNTNPSPEGAELQPANGNTSRKVEWQPKTQANSACVSASTKGKQTVSVSVRRSVRLQGTVTPAHNQDIERVINEIALSESEKEEDEDEPPAYEQTKQPDPSVGNKSLEDKIDYLVQLLEELRDRSGDSPSLSYARYKSLYTDSQKKIGALTEENRQLAMRLENAQGKIEVYEKGNSAISEFLEKFKDVLLFFNMTRVAGTAENVTQATRDAHTSEEDAGQEAKTPPPKRRKLSKERKKN